MITGESRPVDKAEGAKVIAGTVNGSGSLRVTVTGTGERTALANIMRLVGQAQTLAYIDTFWVMAIGTLCLIPLVFCLARPERGRAVAAH